MLISELGLLPDQKRNEPHDSLAVEGPTSEWELEANDPTEPATFTTTVEREPQKDL